MKYGALAEKIFLAGVERVLPENLISKEMMIRGNCLLIGSLEFSLEAIDKIFVIGAGKASAKMAAEVEKILGNRITEGHIVVKYGHSCKLKYIKVTEAGHPVPDSKGYQATNAILKIARKAGTNDLVICLISGGGSALLADFPEESSPEEMISLSNLLINSGASITEINTVRKHLSLVKGGQLARTVTPGTTISLILSDVIGDPLDVIASGPTTPDPTTYKNAFNVLEKYNLTGSVPAGILSYLKSGCSGMIEETPKPGDQLFKKTFNLLIGTNRIALEASKRKAEQLGFSSFIIDDKLQGDIYGVAKNITGIAIKYKDDDNILKPACLLFGGEPTLRMTGHGIGGRNQHLALLCSQLIQTQIGIAVLAAGTDGTDGPTDAAGAVVDSFAVKDALSKNIDPEKYLKEFDSYNFFKNAGGHIITGPTGTNVMDIVIAIIE
jgi:glycerate 2-kinase